MNLFSTLKGIFCCGSSMPAEKEPMLQTNNSLPSTTEGRQQQATTAGDSSARVNDARVEKRVEASRLANTPPLNTPPLNTPSNTSPNTPPPNTSPKTPPPNTSPKTSPPNTSPKTSPGFGLGIYSSQSPHSGTSNPSSPAFSLAQSSYDNSDDEELCTPNL